MQALATELKVQNRTLRQLKREGLVALYLICNSQGESRKRCMGYELAIIQLKKIGATHLEERYPDADQKPKQSWHYDMSEGHWADQGFEALVKREKVARMVTAASPLGNATNLAPSAVDWTSSHKDSHREAA